MALYVDIEPVFKQLTATVVTDDSIGMGVQMGLNRAMEILAKAPIVEVEPVVHAHWEKVYDELGIDRGWRCSHCKGSVYQMTFEPYERCPHCGAHMDEEVAENV